MKKHLSAILIGVLVVLQLYALVKINILENSLQKITEALSSNYLDVNQQIHNLYDRLDHRLNQQESLIETSSADIGTFDLDTFTVPITFTIVPKSVTDTLTISLDFDGEIIPLQKSDMQYSMTKDFLVSDLISPNIILEDNGTKTVQQHDGLNVSYVRDTVFPRITTHFSGEFSYGSSDYRAEGDLRIHHDPSYHDATLTDATYITKIDDQIIEEVPISFSVEGRFNNTVSIDIDIDIEHPLTTGQTLSTWVVATDTLGFTHEYFVDQVLPFSDELIDPYVDQEKITAPDGTVVYVHTINFYAQ